MREVHNTYILPGKLFFIHPIFFEMTLIKTHSEMLRQKRVGSMNPNHCSVTEVPLQAGSLL